MPLSTAPRPSYACQLLTKVQAHVVNGFGIIYLTESLQELTFHLRILPPNGKIINKWETNANPNGPTSQLCMPTLDQSSITFSRWIHRNLFHQIPSGTRV